MKTDLQTVLHYHEETKHQLSRYARSLGFMDWANQPVPFRFYKGTDQISLPIPNSDKGLPYNEIFNDLTPPQPVSKETISRFFFDSMALSAWKQSPGAGSWSLRVNPSSGNLHPTESYLISGPIEGITRTPGVFHYSPYLHGLESRMKLNTDGWDAMVSDLGKDSFFVGLSSIFWRESWKYGERAFRYCNHDIGHAIAALSISASCLGWTSSWVNTNYRTLRRIMGLNNQHGIEAEYPDCLLLIEPVSSTKSPAFSISYDLADRFVTFESSGQPNQLSSDHHPWPIIEDVAEASLYHGETVFKKTDMEKPIHSDNRPGSKLSASTLIRQRRSAVAMDAKTSMSSESFFSILNRISAVQQPPFSTLPWRPFIHLFLFIHRVKGLDSDQTF